MKYRATFLAILLLITVMVLAVVYTSHIVDGRVVGIGDYGMDEGLLSEYSLGDTPTYESFMNAPGDFEFDPGDDWYGVYMGMAWGHGIGLFLAIVAYMAHYSGSNTTARDRATNLTHMYTPTIGGFLVHCLVTTMSMTIMCTLMDTFRDAAVAEFKKTTSETDFDTRSQTVRAAFVSLQDVGLLVFVGAFMTAARGISKGKTLFCSDPNGPMGNVVHALETQQNKTQVAQAHHQGTPMEDVVP
jgi:hypothetical protein